MELVVLEEPSLGDQIVDGPDVSVAALTKVLAQAVCALPLLRRRAGPEGRQMRPTDNAAASILTNAVPLLPLRELMSSVSGTMDGCSLSDSSFEIMFVPSGNSSFPSFSAQALLKYAGKCLCRYGVSSPT